MVCSQPAACTTNPSLLVTSCAKAIPGRPTNSDTTLPRTAHLDSGVIGCHQCITSHSGSVPAFPDMRPTPLTLSRMNAIHYLHPCPKKKYSILPSLTDLFNSSLASGIFPQCFKSALVTSILKKKCLDHNDLNNYRPVCKLCFIAKILEKLVLSQVSSYLNSHNLYNTCQSAYRPGHSTETALLKVVNDLFLSLNKDNISVLALHDFSSAFDTIDHAILVHRLHTHFGFTDTVLQWFSSYLTDRTHYVSIKSLL